MLTNIIQIPYATSPKMQRYSGAVFDLATDITVKDKQYELGKFDKDLYGTLNGANDLIKKIAAHLQLNQTNNILDIALAIDQDIAIMNNGKLVSICFCFPSSWIPSERLGLTFKQIHEPIADNTKLLAASEGIVNAMVNNGPFQRYVWTITNNPAKSNHPKNKLNTVPDTIEDLYFRYETQTTYPLPLLNTALFFVKVTVCPLLEYWNNPDYKKLILNSINSMTNNILEYKNLKHIKEVLNYNGGS
jgi:hypothetical protein